MIPESEKERLRKELAENREIIKYSTLYSKEYIKELKEETKLLEKLIK